MKQLLGREIMREIRESTDMRKYEKRQEVFIGKDSLVNAIDEMICESWNESNAHCRHMKEKLDKFLGEIPEIKERCNDPYWTEIYKVCIDCKKKYSMMSFGSTKLRCPECQLKTYKDKKVCD